VQVANGTYWVYACSPVDRWAGWMTPEEAVEARRAELGSFAEDGDREFKQTLDTAMNRIAVHLLDDFRWEGDGRWLVAVLPDPETCDCTVMFSVKQSNNGTTFIVSPRELPWLAPDVMHPEDNRITLRLDRRMAAHNLAEVQSH